MKKEAIMSKPGAPYSKAVKANGFLFLSGVVSVGADGKHVAGDIKVQTKQVLENLKATVEAAGSSFADVVKVSVFLTNIADFAAMNEVYKTYFTGEPPTRTTVAIKELSSPDFIVEIDLIAAL
jgi:2-iminobutanoate/2-iminopropanoate deaminase